MPVWSIIYINVFAAIVIVNSIFWLHVKQKSALIFYQLGAGFYLIFVMIAYWKGDVLDSLSIYNIPAIVAIVLVDLYISIWIKNKVDILKLLPDLDKDVANLARQFSVIELAKGISLLLYAPAYILSGLVAVKIFKGVFF